jgi:hypothetical protein
MTGKNKALWLIFPVISAKALTLQIVPCRNSFIFGNFLAQFTITISKTLTTNT